MKKVYIALPAYGQSVISLTAQSLFALGQKLMAESILAGIVTLSICDIVEVRNVFLSLWYQTDAEYLLFIDADMAFPADLIVDMINLDQPLVGVVYPAKVYPPRFVGRPIGSPPYDIDRGFIKVDGVGAGIMLIRRDCIDKLLAADPGLLVSPDKSFITAPIIEDAKLDKIICAFDRMIGKEGFKLSEDLSFCRRWRDIGGEIYANVSHDVSHTGQQTIRTRFYEIAAGTAAPNAN